MIRVEQSHLPVAALTHPGMAGKKNEDRYAVTAYHLSEENATPALLAVFRRFSSTASRAGRGTRTAPGSALPVDLSAGLPAPAANLPPSFGPPASPGRDRTTRSHGSPVGCASSMSSRPNTSLAPR